MSSVFVCNDSSFLIHFHCCLLIQIKYYHHHQHHHDADHHPRHQHHDDDDPQGEYSGALPDADGLCARSVTACGKPDLMQYQVFNHNHHHHQNASQSIFFCQSPFVVVFKARPHAAQRRAACLQFSHSFPPISEIFLQ